MRLEGAEPLFVERFDVSFNQVTFAIMDTPWIIVDHRVSTINSVTRMFEGECNAADVSRVFCNPAHIKVFVVSGNEVIVEMRKPRKKEPSYGLWISDFLKEKLPEKWVYHFTRRNPRGQLLAVYSC